MDWSKVPALIGSIAEANINLSPEGEILDEQVIARYKGENVMASREDVDYVDVSPKQIVSIAAGCIPFLENDDTMRALMGSNMQRQALPLLRPHAPFVGTGLEHQIARDSGLAVVAVEQPDDHGPLQQPVRASGRLDQPLSPQAGQGRRRETS